MSVYRVKKDFIFIKKIIKDKNIKKSIVGKSIIQFILDLVFCIFTIPFLISALTCEGMATISLFLGETFINVANFKNPIQLKFNEQETKSIEKIFKKPIDN